MAIANYHCDLLRLCSNALFSLADSPPIESRTRVNTIDGLRGFLALAVFFAHGALYHDYMLTGSWRVASSFFTILAQTGVAFFFMITGFLFWSQLLSKRGRPDWIKLYLTRIFRIAPLYWAAVLLLTVEVIAYNGFHPNVSPMKIILGLGSWLALGLGPQVAINGYVHTGNLMAGVTWTLSYEWKFYLALLPLSVLSRNRLVGLIVPLAAFMISLIYIAMSKHTLVTAGPVESVAMFAAGMICAGINTYERPRRPSSVMGSCCGLAAMIALFLMFNNALGVAQIMLITVTFYLISSGTDAFGILTSRPARRLGNISFGIYLLQGLVLAASAYFPSIKQFALSSPTAHWTVIGADAVILTLLSTLAHAFVERPGIELGRRMAQKARLVWSSELARW